MKHSKVCEWLIVYTTARLYSIKVNTIFPNIISRSAQKIDSEKEGTCILVEFGITMKLFISLNESYSKDLAVFLFLGMNRNFLFKSCF